MKRVAVIAIFMAIMASLFAFPAFADNNFEYITSVSNQSTINGLVITLKANRGSLVNTGTAALGYSGYCPVLITITLQNNNTQNVLVNNLKWLLTTNSGGNYTHIVGFEQISNDLIVTSTPYDLNDYISVSPSVDYSYGSGIVVPAGKTLYFVCTMNVYANYDTNNNSWAVPSLHYIGYDQNITVTTGNYPAGQNSEDFSELISVLNSINNNVATEAELEIVSDQVSDIIDILTYTGTVPSINLNAVSTYTIQKDYGYYHVIARRYVSDPYLVDSTIVLDTGNDNSIIAGTKRYDITLIITEYDNWNNRLIDNENLIDGVLQSGTYNDLIVDSIYSDSFITYSIDNNRLHLFRKNVGVGTNKYLLNSGRHIHVINCHIDVNYNVNVTFPNLVLDNYTSSYDTSNIYAPDNEYQIIRDLYIAYSSVNGLDDIDNTADDIKDKSESAHTQEQNYFTQNAQAIQQTGLSNYRFNNDQENGIGSVSHDFTLLWNALGGFNSIYIFSLTLSLALMVLRHAPGVIRSSRRNKEE